MKARKVQDIPTTAEVFYESEEGAAEWRAFVDPAEANTIVEALNKGLIGEQDMSRHIHRGRAEMEGRTLYEIARDALAKSESGGQLPSDERKE